MSPSLPLRILYLEDDPLDAELAILRLEENEFACDWHRVATQDEFIASLENGAYDLILADYNLPTFTGLEALKLFTETNLDIPFIIVSGNLWEELAVETLKLGATDYVLKDRLSRLGLAVRRALDEKQIQRQRRADAQKIQHLLQHQMAANQLSIALGDARQLEDVYQIIHEYVRDLMRVDTFIISSFSHQTNLIHAKYVFTNGQVCDVTAYPPIPLNESENGGPQSQVIITGKAIYYPDYLAAIEASKTLYHISDTGQVNKTHPISEYEEPVTRSAIFAPIKEKGETVGVIQVQSHELEGYEQDDVDILAALANVAAIAIQNASLLENTQRQLHKLEALHNIDVAISASIDVQITLNILLEQVEAHLNADACSIALLPANANMLDYKSVRGFRSQTLAYSMFRLGEGLAGRVALERKIIHIEDLSQLDEEGIQPFIREQFLTYYGLPLISKGQVKGVLEIFYRSTFKLDQEWLDFLKTLATQAAIAIDNTNLFEQLQYSNFELTMAYDTTLEGWAKALELRDRETVGHGRRVTEMTIELAQALDVHDSEIVHIRRGALLHDIGKMGIPDHILQKPGPLTDEEIQIMRQHVTYAYEWLSPIRYLQKALDIPYCHHENWDGSGYPRGLKNEQIPLAARIFSVVDVWDALTSDRPYRKAWSKEKTRDYIREYAGQYFDPQVVNLFLKFIQDD